MATTATIDITGATMTTATDGEVGQTLPSGAPYGVPGGPPAASTGGGQLPTPPPLALGENGRPLPKSYLEYYTLRRDFDPPLEGVMDAFKSGQRNDPQLVVKTHDELNTKLILTRDSTNHGYVMLAKTDKRLVVVHRLSH